MKLLMRAIKVDPKKHELRLVVRALRRSNKPVPPQSAKQLRKELQRARKRIARVVRRAFRKAKDNMIRMSRVGEEPPIPVLPPAINYVTLNYTIQGTIP